MSSSPLGSTNPRRTALGAAAAAACYGFWGTAGLFLHALSDVSPLQIVVHRALWSLVALFPFILSRTCRLQFRRIIGSRRMLGAFFLSAALIACNWLLFAYAVSTQRALEASLGYYVVPLLFVAFSALFFKEPFTRRQAFALTPVVLGVLVLVVGHGGLPWIGLGLAVTFCLYGLLRKTTPVSAVVGLFTETLILAPLALGALTWFETRGVGALDTLVLREGRIDVAAVLVVGSMLWTALPLILFGFAAQALRLSTLGLLQYASPTLQVIVAVLLLGESMDLVQGIAFALIWSGVAIYAWPVASSASAAKD